MGLSYYDQQQKPKTALAKAWMYFNAVIAAGFVFYWSGLASYFADPLKWALRVSVGIQPNLFEYPYLALWSTPVLCMIGGWLAMKSGQHSLARIIGGYPTMMLALMLSWYYLAPLHWL